MNEHHPHDLHNEHPAHPTFVEQGDMHCIMMQMWRSYLPEYRDRYFELKQSGGLNMQMHFLAAEHVDTGDRLRWLVMSLRTVPYPIDLDGFANRAFGVPQVKWQLTAGLPPDLKAYIAESEAVGLGHFAPVNLSLQHRGISRANGLEWTLVLVGDYIL